MQLPLIPEPRPEDFCLTAALIEELNRAFAAGVRQESLLTRIFTLGKAGHPPKEDPRLDFLRAALCDYRIQEERLKRLLKRIAEEKLKSEEQFWRSLSGTAFEEEVAALLETLGKTVKRVGGSGDGGIDLFVDGVPAQCKQHNRPQGPKVVRELLGSCASIQVTSGLLITTSGVTDGAQAFAAQHNILVWDARELVRMARTRGTRQMGSTVVTPSLWLALPKPDDWHTAYFLNLRLVDMDYPIRQRDWPDLNAAPDFGYLAGHLERLAYKFLTEGRVEDAKLLRHRAARLEGHAKRIVAFLSTRGVVFG